MDFFVASAYFNIFTCSSVGGKAHGLTLASGGEPLEDDQDMMEKRTPRAVSLKAHMEAVDEFTSDGAAKKEAKGSDTNVASMYQGQEKLDKECTRAPPRQHEQIHPGAFAVPGSDAADTITQQSSHFQVDDPVTAELVDTDVEKQIVREQVQMSLQKERAKAPVAEVVEERFCDRRMIGMAVLAILVILGIVLGVTLTRDKGPPPAPVPSEGDIIEVLSVASFDGGEALQTPGSPQNEALYWLANDTFQGYYTEDKLIQRYALATIFYSTNGNSWMNSSMWLDDGDECDRWWQSIGGISCDSTTGGITSLGLGSNNLKGTIPPETGLLTSLLELDLSENDLKGTIPTQVGKLASLEGLNLKKSKLTGSIPEVLANITTLKMLSLAENELTGSFVASIGKLSRMEDLMLFDNKLTGKLPDTISKLQNMKSLNVRENQLSGSIPTGIGKLALVTELSLYSNRFSGTIPAEVGLLTRLATLNLRSNNFTGPVPSTIVNMTLLTSLNLRENDFTGTIPQLITELTNLGEYTQTTDLQCCYKFHLYCVSQHTLSAQN